MNQNNILPDDPRLTAYALNEMEPAERAAFEVLLRDDPEARRTVAAIGAVVPDLELALAAEPLVEEPAVAATTADAGEIRPGTDSPQRSGDVGPRRDRLPKVTPFPYYWVAGLAAACFAVGFVVWQAGYLRRERVRYTEIDLTRMSPANEARPADESALAAKDAGAAVAVQDHAELNAPLLAVDLVAAKNAPGGLADRTASPAPGSISVALPVLNDGAGGARADQGTVVADSLVKAADAVRAATETVGPTSAGAVAAVERKVEPYAVAALPVPAVSGARVRTQLHRTEAEIADSGRGFAEGSRIVAPTGLEQAMNTETYDHRADNPFVEVRQEPLSTFAIDVDTAAYANVRRFLQAGQRPPRDAVRIEELVNYFPYDYAAPVAKDVPFAAALEVAAAPWRPEHRLVRIGLKGREVAAGERGAANLVFLLDVSGSMNAPNKLPLVQESMRLLVGKLRADDRVAIVVYAGSSGLALPSTAVAESRTILEAIDRLSAGGSTNGALGIQLAYDVAKANFVAAGVNRVVLCTDGDFNVGVTNRGDLTRLIEEKAKSGVFLTVLGFGMGNLKEATLEQLANKGNGHYGYIDSRREAQKLLVEQVGGTLVTIAKDVKIQVEFNPAEVQAYRLIGYENRLLRKEDFNNDRIDAGEIGAGHTVTALYEVVPAGVAWAAESGVDALKYQPVGRGEESDRVADARFQAPSPKVQAPSSEPQGPNSRLRAPGARLPVARAGELLTVKLRYKAPEGDVSRLLEFPLRDTGRRFEEASHDFKFAAAVASFGLLLRESPHRGGATLAEVSRWAADGMAGDPGGYRQEFLGLVKLAESRLR